MFGIFCNDIGHDTNKPILKWYAIFSKLINEWIKKH